MNFPHPARILITGASRGLGLEFARLWLDAGHQVFALARNPADSPGLQELESRFPSHLRSLRCDVAQPESIDAAARAVSAATEALDVIVNNAGIYGARKRDRLDEVDFEDLQRVFAVNAVGPLRVARAFLPMLKCGVRPRLAQLTSLMGSIADNGSGGSYGYRMSKAALNMANRNLAHDLVEAGIPSVVLHPGWVATDMGGRRAPLGIEDSVRAMITVIEGLDLEHTGRFFDRNGKELPW